MIIDEYNESYQPKSPTSTAATPPLSIRIVQCIFQKSYLQSLHRPPLPLTPNSTDWAGFEDILKSVDGITILRCASFVDLIIAS
jgi:vacuolar protein sorting-associated protein 33A